MNRGIETNGKPLDSNQGRRREKGRGRKIRIPANFSLRENVFSKIASALHSTFHRRGVGIEDNARARAWLTLRQWIVGGATDHSTPRLRISSRIDRSKNTRKKATAYHGKLVRRGFRQQLFRDDRRIVRDRGHSTTGCAFDR